MTDERIAGALIDFMGYLTTRPEPLTVGAAFEVYPMHDALEAWCKLRGFDMATADVLGWNDFEKIKEPA